MNFFLMVLSIVKRNATQENLQNTTHQPTIVKAYQAMIKEHYRFMVKFFNAMRFVIQTRQNFLMSLIHVLVYLAIETYTQM